jgi:hypothetical protein
MFPWSGCGLGEGGRASKAKNAKPRKGGRMTKPEVSGDKQPPGQTSLDEIKTLVANLDEAGKQAVAAQATQTASGDAKPGLVTQVVRSANSVESRKAAVAEAVNSASPENKVEVAGKAVEQLSPQQQKEVARQILPITQGTADQIWITVVNAFKWVLWGATLALVGAVGVSLFRPNVDQALVQILLTVFTTVAGIFAGFIGGKALGSSNGE